MLRSVDWHLITEVSGQYIRSTARVELGHYGTNRLSGNVGKYQTTLRNIQEERTRRLHRGGSLK